MRRKARPQPGFVLLLTLMLLALAAVLLADLTLASTTRALEVIVAQEKLQRKWGIVSIEQASLQRADALLAAQHDPLNAIDDATSAPRWISRLYTLQLGNLRFNWILQDEQAKLNLNTIYQQQGRDAVERQVREQLALFPKGAAIHLRPDRHADAGPRQAQARERPPASREHSPADVAQPPPAFGAWSEVFGALDPADLGGFAPPSRPNSQVVPMTASITCWGDGRLHLLRTRSDILAARFHGVLDPRQADALIQWAVRQEAQTLAQWLAGPPSGASADETGNPGAGAAAAAASALAAAPSPADDVSEGSPIDEATRQKIASGLTLASTCFSMAMQVVTPARTEYHWVIDLQTQAGDAPASAPELNPLAGSGRIVRFVWP